MQERALKTGRPVLYLMDSSGGRIDQQSGFFANRQGIGKYYYNHSMLSGRVPQICVLYGPCIAGAAYTPVFADFTIMVRGMSAMAIASPRMVEMVTGEKIDLQDLGGPDVHSNTPAARTSSPTTRNTRGNSSRSLSAISPTTPTRNRHSPAERPRNSPRRGSTRSFHRSPTRATTCST